MRNLIKMSFFEGLNRSFDSLFSNIKFFMFFSILCSFASSIVYFILNVVPVNSFVAFILFSILFVLIISFFINCWFDCLNSKNEIIKVIKAFSVKGVFRTSLFVFLTILSWGVILGISFYLYRREVVFSFWTELFLFLGFTGIVIFCFFFLLNHVVLVCFLKKEKCFIFHKIFWGIFDNINQILGWGFFVFIVFFMLSREIMGMSFLPSFIMNMFNTWSFFLCLAFYLSILKYQYEKIFDNKD